uniref:Uncharacterized protein n=1 Tax=Anguilla anguilla TaxID=7936 RepID=A0A0E9QN24_ANGAN
MSSKMNCTTVKQMAPTKQLCHAKTYKLYLNIYFNFTTM